MTSESEDGRPRARVRKIPPPSAGRIRGRPWNEGAGTFVQIHCNQLSIPTPQPGRPAAFGQMTPAHFKVAVALRWIAWGEGIHTTDASDLQIARTCGFMGSNATKRRRVQRALYGRTIQGIRHGGLIENGWVELVSGYRSSYRILKLTGLFTGLECGDPLLRVKTPSEPAPDSLGALRPQGRSETVGALRPQGRSNYDHRVAVTTTTGSHSFEDRSSDSQIQSSSSSEVRTGDDDDDDSRSGPQNDQEVPQEAPGQAEALEAVRLLMGARYASEIAAGDWFRDGISGRWDLVPAVARRVGLRVKRPPAIDDVAAFLLRAVRNAITEAARPVPISSQAVVAARRDEAEAQARAQAEQAAAAAADADRWTNPDPTAEMLAEWRSQARDHTGAGFMAGRLLKRWEEELARRAKADPGSA